MEDTIKQIMSLQLTEEEIMIYLLVVNGWSYRQVADELPFGITYGTVMTIFKRAKVKFENQAQAGFFVTPVQNV
jgi:DNA-directed RNA polymerase specialized sigma24 family protein